MEKIPVHIILDYRKFPNELHCVNCGASRELHLPAPISDVSKQAEAFTESHRFCKKQGIKDSVELPPERLIIR